MRGFREDLVRYAAAFVRSRVLPSDFFGPPPPQPDLPLIECSFINTSHPVLLPFKVVSVPVRLVVGGEVAARGEGVARGGGGCDGEGAHGVVAGAGRKRRLIAQGRY